MTFLTIFNFFADFRLFWWFLTFLTIFNFFADFRLIWRFSTFDDFWLFWRFSTFLTIFNFFDNFQLFWQFLTFLTHSVPISPISLGLNVPGWDCFSSFLGWVVTYKHMVGNSASRWDSHKWSRKMQPILRWLLKF